ncbi:GNAT family N-acetyltransferase [Lysobacter pythonis]|uniref:GNAT family N-acetyltransferase n=1 Tax=Solilutibacter pythonis TaxID=2483112 RepID=A0A3M2HVM1_9GAMM|nr:GNAT family N-acetyltransferase [Lysobacter pythonis]RMH93068.1 GNAT family N-acetyltransferase [Lysobacter pythonis]
MSIVIRDVLEHELDSVLALNNAAGPGILPIDAARMRRFHDQAEYFRVAKRDGHIAGVLIAFGSGSQHDSRNFRWFAERHAAFLYIDRIVVASRRRGGGVGRALYADVHGYAEARYPELCCEVFLQEGTDPALLFHGSFGFREEGQNPQADGTRACMLVKPMCSHEWIHRTYGETLPNEPWVTRSRTPSAERRPTGTCP